MYAINHATDDPEFNAAVGTAGINWILSIVLLLFLNIIACNPNAEVEDIIVQKDEYEFYLRGFYLSSDGSEEDKIYIQPIEYITKTDLEEIEKYGLENEDWAQGYHILDGENEVIPLFLKMDQNGYVVLIEELMLP